MHRLSVDRQTLRLAAIVVGHYDPNPWPHCTQNGPNQGFEVIEFTTRYRGFFGA